MKTNCKISKIIASLLVMATILCFGATGFAASYSTVTTYNLADNTVTVTSNVTGMAQNEQVTYLATYGANNDILYVDQAAADESATDGYGKTFTYSTEANKVVNTTVKFGAATTTPIAPILTGKDDTLANVNVAVTTGNSKVTVSGVDVASGFTIGKGQIVTATVKADNGYEVESITVNGSSVDKALTSFNVEGIDGASIVIVTRESAVTTNFSGETVSALVDPSTLVENREFSLFSQLALSPSQLADPTTEYGIIVLMDARSDVDATEENLHLNGTKYKAYAIGDMQENSISAYSVVIQGKGAKSVGGKTLFATGQKIVSAPYVTVNGVTSFGAMQTIICE